MSCNSQKQHPDIVTADIHHFWEAYDYITATHDSALQYKLIDSLYFDRGTDGLEAIAQLRNYTPEAFVTAINSYPKFWSSIRPNTFKADQYSIDLAQGIEQLKALYPNLKPAKIYFTIGILRTNGTTLDSMVLIGSELALANQETPTDEFPENLSHLPSYFNSEPSKNIVFLNIHEYVHTQQKTTIGNTLLAQTILEGAAEFVAEKALGTQSPNPQIEFGRNNDAAIKEKYQLEMFSPNVYNWLWNSSDNEFGMRVLAYYVGYQICADYYETMPNKTLAIKEMIELDYNNENDLIEFVEKSGYFDQPLDSLKLWFEKSRPIVEGIAIHEAENDTNQAVVLSIHFSQEMDTLFRNFQLGPLGAENVIVINDYLGFSKDKKSVRFAIKAMEPAKKYQIVVGEGYRNTAGVPLIPYLIELG